MGTRNLTLIQVDGETKVAQYGQWDGYPSGRGVAILEVLRNADLQKLKDRVRALRATPDSDDDGPEWKKYLRLKAAFDKEHESDYSEATRKRQLSQLLKTPGYRWSRDCGGNGILTMLLDDELTFNDVALNEDFAGDGLFCEWAYIIDLDRNMLEVYAGFGKDSLPEGARFKHLEKDDEEYKPVHIVAEYPLDNLPANEAFVTECDPPEPEDAAAPETATA